MILLRLQYHGIQCFALFAIAFDAVSQQCIRNNSTTCISVSYRWLWKAVAQPCGESPVLWQLKIFRDWLDGYTLHDQDDFSKVECTSHVEGQ